MVTPLIQIVEVGPRDGLQNEEHIWSVQERVNLIDLLSLCGFVEIEVGSFVSPKWVPQMADTAEVFRQIHPHPNVRYSTLVPNERGMNEALMVGMNNVSIFTAASEAFNQKNTNCSIEESFVRFEPVMAKAKEHNIRVRGYVSCVVVCPFSGSIDPNQVANVAERLWQMGCSEISLGDTIGKGTPETITRMVQVVKDRVPVEALAIHCHDTYGVAMDNVLSALTEGIRIVDASIYGLGGCPYGGENAKGNIATEKVVNVLGQYHYQTPIHLEALTRVSEFVRLTLAGKKYHSLP